MFTFHGHFDLGGDLEGHMVPDLGIKVRLHCYVFRRLLFHQMTLAAALTFFITPVKDVKERGLPEALPQVTRTME